MTTPNRSSALSTSLGIASGDMAVAEHDHIIDIGATRSSGCIDRHVFGRHQKAGLASPAPDSQSVRGEIFFVQDLSTIWRKVRMTEKNSGPEEGIKGVVEDVKGKTKETVGTVTGRDDMVREGKAQQDKAEAESARAGAKTAEQRQEAEQR